MAGLFDGFTKKATDAKDKAVQTTKDVQETAKLNASIREEQKKIESGYRTIGELYYNKYRDNPEEELSGPVKQVKESNEKIEKYQEQIRAIKGIILCESCGAEIPADSTFCSSCGQKITKMQPASRSGEEKAVCPSCGAALEPGARFCTSCGTPVPAETAAEESSAGEPEKSEWVVCRSCGAVMKPGTAFCIECGAKMG